MIGCAIILNLKLERQRMKKNVERREGDIILVELELLWHVH